MAPLVRRDDVQTRSQAESDASYERIDEAYSGEIQISVAVQEATHLMMRLDELVKGICKS